MKALLLLSLVVTSALSEPVVVGPFGKLTGKIQEVLNVELESFLGIPYAKPPVGDLRFALPVPFGPVGDFKATKYGSACPQKDFGLLETRGWSLEEDCLYLNVVRRKGTRITNKKAVIAIIHGGGYIMGSSSDSYQNAEALAARGDVIVVSFNYRLGVLGFADMEDLAPGNLGLRDQRLALKWIQDHIADFGGDPDRVTAIGVSAGSMSLAAQIITPIDGKNLFQSAVLDAGVVASNGFYEDAESSFIRIKKIAEQLGCAVGGEEMLTCLRNAKVEDLVPLSFNVTGGTGIKFFVATEDGEFIPKDVERFVENNSAKLRKVSAIIGYAKDEGTSFVNSELFENDFVDTATKEETLAHIAKVSASYNHPLDLSNRKIRNLVSEFYVDKYPGNPRKAVAELQADGVFKCPVNNFVRSYARHNEDVFVYQFERILRGTYFVNPNRNELGAFHYSPYVHFSGVLFMNKEPIDPEDRTYSLETMDMICSFAKNEDAPSFRGVEWPRFSETEEILIWNDTPSTRKGLSSERTCREVFNRNSLIRVRSEF